MLQAPTHVAWLDTILQAAYLLGQSKLDPNSKKWTKLIDSAAQDAARILNWGFALKQST